MIRIQCRARACVCVCLCVCVCVSDNVFISQQLQRGLHLIAHCKLSWVYGLD
jgi:hypothetical protein